MSTLDMTRPKPSSDAAVGAGIDSAANEDSAKRQQILEGARQVFLTDGFDGASMNDVAREAGVSKGTLYVYFDSKVALFEALVREERQQQAERLCIIYDDDDAELRATLIQFGVNLVEMMTRPSNIAQVRTVLAVAPKFPQVGRAFYESGPQVGLTRLAAYLGRRIAKGELAIDDLPLAAAQLLELFHAGLLKPLMFCAGDTPSRAEIERKVTRNVDVFLAAYTRKPSD